LLSSLHRIALAQIAPDTLDDSFGDIEELKKLAHKFTAEDIQLFYQIGVKGRADLRAGVDVKSAFEMLLLRMMVFSPDLVDEELKPVLSSEPVKEQDDESDRVKKKTDAGVSEPKETVSTVPDQAQTEHAPEALGNSVEPEGESEDPVPMDSSDTRAIGLQELDRSTWLMVFPKLDVSGIAANVLANVIVESCVGDEIRFLLDQSQSAVYSEDLLPKIGQALSRYFERPVKVSISIGSVDAETPAQLAARLKQEFKNELVEQFEADDNVQQLIERFAANVEKETITPIESNG